LRRIVLKQLLGLLMTVLLYHTALAQNSIVGIWEGDFIAINTYGLGEPKLVIEIFESKDSLFTGITHLYYEEDKYEHYKMVGRYLKKDSLLIIKEASTIAVDLGNIGNCLGTYVLRFSKKAGYLLLEGIWVSNRYGCSRDTKVILKKKIPTPLPAPVPQKITTPKTNIAAVKNKPIKKIEPTTNTDVPAPMVKDLPVIKPVPVKMPPQITQRQTDIQSLLEIASADKDSIRVDVYDNGDIDGDSVSVYEEGLARINHKMITANPLTFYVSLDKNLHPITHLRLVAESLGTIPPCTALMIVTTKSKRYEVRLSSNFKKNATLELFLKE
jgi:hypothetical protein